MPPYLGLCALPPYLGQIPLLNMQISYSCIVSANLQINFSLSLTIVARYEFEKKILSFPRHRHHYLKKISIDGTKLCLVVLITFTARNFLHADYEYQHLISI